MVLSLKKFKYFFPSGTSQCFLGECNDGNDWVIRLKKLNKDAHRLLSEYFCGFLGKNLGLSCPGTSLVRFDQSKIPSLPNNFTDFDPLSTIGVGSKFIKNLKHFPRPENYAKLLMTKNFPIINKEHIIKSLPNHNDLSQFYGIIMFIKWTYMANYHKYENLYIKDDGRICFLDFDLAFSFNINSWVIPNSYDYFQLVGTLPPFTLGIEENIEEYKFWFNSLKNLSHKDADKSLLDIPKCWDIPSEYLQNLVNFLFSNRDQFLKLYTEAASNRIRDYEKLFKTK